MSDSQSVLDAARLKESEREAERRKRQKEQEEERQRRVTTAEEELLPNLRDAKLSDYIAWLKGYIEQGGRPTHVYDYPFGRWRWVVATGNINPVPLFGTDSVNIIIPAGIQVGVGDWGHCNLFLMDGYEKTRFVPIFSDTNF